MNLLFFIETGSGNGRSIADEAIAIQKTRALNICTASSGKDQENGVLESIELSGIDNLELEGMDEHKNFFAHSKALRKYVKEKKFDIIHVQTNWELILTWYAILGLKNKPKMIYTIHSFRNNRAFLIRNTVRVAISFILILFADKVITCSRFMYESFRILKYKSTILPLGVDNRYIERPFKKVEGPMKIVFPGKFRIGKGQDMLIKGFAQYVQESGDKNSLVYLPGDGELIESCKRLTDTYGVQEQIIFPGKLSKENLLELFDQCNIVACTSRSETFSQVLAEGYCLGKCIVTRPVGIAKDIVDNGKNGFIVEDAEQLKEVFHTLSQQGTKIIEMGKNNYDGRMRFSWNNIMDGYISICKSLIKA